LVAQETKAEKASTAASSAAVSFVFFFKSIIQLFGELSRSAASAS
jgi:hypothetical protein